MSLLSHLPLHLPLRFGSRPAPRTTTPGVPRGLAAPGWGWGALLGVNRAKGERRPLPSASCGKPRAPRLKSKTKPAAPRCRVLPGTMPPPPVAPTGRGPHLEWNWGSLVSAPGRDPHTPFRKTGAPTQGRRAAERASPRETLPQSVARGPRCWTQRWPGPLS